MISGKTTGVKGVDHIQKRLETVAWKMSDPFCYSCYKIAPTGTCKECMSDDLMRHLEGYGVEYGIDWIVKHILSDLEEYGTEDQHEEWLNEIYDTRVEICGYEFYAQGSMLRKYDPMAFGESYSNWFSDLNDQSDNYWSPDLGSTFYDARELLKVISDLEDELGIERKDE